ncbi:DUF7504 family protein [Haloplanus natans]|uniref:DUF7504 family protein n=1 Tax=Haloplanus natans TaxID=376171 RepID=UPI0006782B64|nr:hypothetical protein [Haloplanus natans]
MVYRWQCRRCAFGCWTASGDAAAEAVGAHLLDHAESNLRRDDVGVAWRCPHCGTQGETYAGDDDDAVDAFKSHLFGHAASQLEAGAHVADAVGGTGNVLVIAPSDDAADNARTHFLSRGDHAMIVTANPADRLRLLDRALPSWPASTTVVTTVTEPLSEVDIDPSARSIEVLMLDGRPDLSGVGETLSRAIGARQAAGTLSVEFDILPDLLETFELRTVFRFLHLLSARLERERALAHCHLDPRYTQRASINVLEGAFDLSIRAEGSVFVAESNG